MYEAPQFEIPEAVREIAERNVEQARSAYGQFMDMTRQAQDLVAKSQGSMAASALDIQTRAMRYAEQNIDQSFRFASDLARARNIKEYVEIQTKYAQTQMQAYASQAQDLGRMLADAAAKAKPNL